MRVFTKDSEIMNLLRLVGNAIAAGHADGIELTPEQQKADKLTKKIIAKNLRKRRREQNKTQGQITCEIGITTPTYGHYERGRFSLETDTLHRIAAALGTTLNELKEERT